MNLVTLLEPPDDGPSVGVLIEAEEVARRSLMAMLGL